jgi:hypothetical protein
MKTLSEFKREIARLDPLLKPIADRPVDITDPNWAAKLVGFDPLEEAGVKRQAQDLLSEILVRYVDGTNSDREELRQMFQEFGSFSWAARLREEPINRAGLRAHLILLSIQDQGTDPRDSMMAIDGLISIAMKQGEDIRPLLAEVAEISSTQSRYGMGSMKEILLSRRRAD